MKQFLRAACLVLMVCGMGCKPKVPVAPATPQNNFILLPDEDGHVGGITVSNKGGSVDLTNGFTGVAVLSATQPPSAPSSVSQAEADRIYGSALRAMPDAQRSFLIYFELSKDELSPEMRAVLNDAIQAIKDRASTDVSVVGHADTGGDSAANFQLALRRARTVAELLISLGVDAKILAVESHGDADLLVKTGRGVAEARNRRVEIVVR